MNNYTQEAILEAWKIFISRGVILKDKVRPVIARSWVRCCDLGIDPWSADFPKCSAALLEEKRNQYADWLLIAQPVMNYVFSLLNCNVSLCDSQGFVFELISPLKSYPRTLGTYVAEATCGNGALTISLCEKIPIRTEGYEKYRIISQPYSGVCSPIADRSGTLIGALSAISLFGALPEKALPLIIAAANIIEYQLMNKTKRVNLVGMDAFQEMLDCSPQAVMILNESGKIMAVNKICQQLVEMPGSANFAGVYLDDLIAGKKGIFHSIHEDEQTASLEFQFKAFNEKRDLGTSKFRLMQKSPVKFADGSMHTIIVFDKCLSSNKVKSEGSIENQLAGLLSQETRFIGKSPAWAKVNNFINKVAPFPSDVLLLGETGTGKEVVAREIHRISHRPGGFVDINCGAIPRELLQSELFGYEGGAFTGARSTGVAGKFEQAHEGTLFLDEIGEMPLDMQVSLLRLLQERTVTRLSSSNSKKVDVRIIAATNKDLADMVKNGHFREDLFYRINVMEITLPPLRERKSDIPLLADYFMAELSRQYNLKPKALSKHVMEILVQYDWPGNVRELKNVLEKALILAEDDIINADVLPVYLSAYISSSDQQLWSPVDISERKYIIQLMEKYEGNITRTAKALNIARNTLYSKLLKHNIDPKDFGK